MYDAQLEMGFDNNAGCVTRRQRRLNRAHWWFQRMRQIVDRTIEWQTPPPSPRPEQIWLPGAQRAPVQPGSEAKSMRNLGKN